MQRTLLWVGALALAFLPSWAQACSICGCGDPLQAAGTTLPMAGQLRLALDAETLNATAQSDDDATVTESLTQFTLKPVLVYNPSNSLALVLQVPLVEKKWSTSDDTAALTQTDNSGLGDIDLGGRWFFFQDIHLPQKWSQTMAFSLGSSFPTGASAIEVNGSLIDQHAQLGTGAVGPYAGLLYGRNQDGWSLSANATYRYRGTNAQGYQYGQAVSYGLSGQFHLIEAFALSLGLEGRYADYDQNWAAGAIAAQTGGSVLDLSPGFGWQLGENFGVNGKVQFPIYTNLFGTQTVSPVASLSVQYLFKL
jgi:hypothetical protein